MAVRISPVGRQQFFSNQGAVAAGMKLFTYAAGTTTKLSTYTDSTGNTANANPVVLGSDGRTPSGLWLTDGTLYKFVLAPANDTDPPASPIWTEDNIGTTEASLADFANTSDAAKGDALVGVKRTDTGATGTTLHTWIEGQTVDPKTEFGCAADGSTDDQVKFQKAINTGKIVELRGRTYAIGSQLTWNQNGGGIRGPGHIVMLTGAGQFQETTVANKYQTDACGIYVQGYDDVLFEGFKMSLGGSPSNDSVCMAIAIRDSERSKVRWCEFTAFKKSDGIVAVDSSFHCQVVFNDLHDCAANGATNGQLTAINVDDDRISSVTSERCHLSYNTIKNLTVDATFLAANGYQADGINISVSAGAGGHSIVGNLIDTVGEGIDCFGSNNVIAGNTIIDAYGVGIKLVHGASYNNVHGNVIDGLCRYGIGLHGSSTASQDTQYNLVEGNVIRNVNSASNWATPSAGIAADNSGTFIAKNNMIRGNTILESANAHWGIRAGTGTANSNEWYDNRLYGTFVTARVQNGDVDYYRAANKSHVRASRITTAQTITTGTLTDIVFNSETIDSNSEFDTATGILTATEPRRVVVTAAFRSNDGVSGNLWELFISKNGATTQRFARVCAMVGGEDSMLISGSIELNVGDTLRIKVRHDKGSDMTITADGAMTYIDITEI